MRGECVVYWLHDATCADVQQDGYVGISAQLTTRLSRHRKAAKFPPFLHAILFTGTREQCLAMERQLRPQHGIGWNWAAGGDAGGQAPKTPEHRAKMSAAARTRYADPRERELARQYQVGKHDHRGEKNPHHGKPLSEQARSNISNGRMGKGLGNQNWRNRQPYTEETLRKMSEGSKRRWALSPRSIKENHSHACIVQLNSSVVEDAALLG